MIKLNREQKHTIVNFILNYTKDSDFRRNFNNLVKDYSIKSLEELEEKYRDKNNEQKID